MAKDPAFLFYSKDWIQGTAKLMPEEKGVYIDLLAHQHQDGDLPQETKRLSRMVGMSEIDFLLIWEAIKDKFITTDTGRLVNKKLTDITTERLTIGHTNKIVSALGVAVRKSEAPFEIKQKAKLGFKVDDFRGLSDTEITIKVTEWFTERLTKLFGDGNGDAIAINNTLVNKEGVKQNFSNLNRQPNIPDLNKVEEVFLRGGGTKEMAKSFFEKHEGTGWFINGSPIVNFTALANKFIDNWNRNNDEKNKQPDPSKVKIKLA